MIGFIRKNSRLIAILGFGYIGAAEYGAVEYPNIRESLPDGWGILVVAALAGAAAAYYYSDRILDLLPDDEGIYLVAFKSSDDTGGEIWELTEDQFDSMTVVEGSLFQWPTSKRVYEAREYRPEGNVAVANWRESVAASELAGNVNVVDALEAIGELRDEFEPEARKYRLLQRRIRGVVRKLDYRRLEDQQSILDQHMAPSFDSDDATIGAVLREEIPDELLPESMDATDGDRLTGDTNGRDQGEFVGFDILDDTEAIEPEDEP